jgi:hypothetical protein
MDVETCFDGLGIGVGSAYEALGLAKTPMSWRIHYSPQGAKYGLSLLSALFWVEWTSKLVSMASA